jgi:hypothetical protein
MTRIALFGDPTKALGTVAEAECARVVAALDLAEKLSVPVEWFALSSGATISMDSGTENMDWVSGRSAESSRSPKTAVRSTSSSRESTSTRSRIGMPKRRCCIPPRITHRRNGSKSDAITYGVRWDGNGLAAKPGPPSG